MNLLMKNLDDLLMRWMKMIKAIFYKKEKRITDYEISGHAFFSSFGTDIVCAGVSVLTTAITNNLSGIEFSKTDTGIKVNNIVDSSDNKVLIFALIDGLLSIEDEHPNHVVVVIQDE